MNYLEQLAAEWYSYQGYFVRTNVKARKRARGGWDAELDVLAYKPKEQRLVHLELSADANTWRERKERFLGKKFVLGKAEYESILDLVIEQLERVAVVGYARTTPANRAWGNEIRVVLIPEFLGEIISHIRTVDPLRQAVPEGFPLSEPCRRWLTGGRERNPRPARGRSSDFSRQPLEAILEETRPLQSSHRPRSSTRITLVVEGRSQRPRC